MTPAMHPRLRTGAQTCRFHTVTDSSTRSLPRSTSHHGWMSSWVCVHIGSPARMGAKKYLRSIHVRVQSQFRAEAKHKPLPVNSPSMAISGPAMGRWRGCRRSHLVSMIACLNTHRAYCTCCFGYKHNREQRCLGQHTSPDRAAKAQSSAWSVKKREGWARKQHSDFRCIGHGLTVGFSMNVCTCADGVSA